MGGGHRAVVTGSVVDVSLDGRLEHGSTVEVRAGGGESSARVGWLGARFHQLRCDARLALAAGDVVEVRSGGEVIGGFVLDPDAPRHGPSNDLLIRLTDLERTYSGNDGAST